MRVLLLLLLLCACGATRIENVRGDDAAVDSDAALDSSVMDVPGADAPSVDAPNVDAVLMGNCTPTISECPNVATTLEMGTPFSVNGALVQGQANAVASSCGGGGTSEWTIAVTASEAGLFQYLFSSDVRYGIEIRDGGCAGGAISCGVTNNTQSATGIAAGQTYLIVIEAATSCDAPFDLTLTLLPR